MGSLVPNIYKRYPETVTERCRFRIIQNHSEYLCSSLRRVLQSVQNKDGSYVLLSSMPRHDVYLVFSGKFFPCLFSKITRFFSFTTTVQLRKTLETRQPQRIPVKVLSRLIFSPRQGPVPFT